MTTRVVCKTDDYVVAILICVSGEKEMSVYTSHTNICVSSKYL